MIKSNLKEILDSRELSIRKVSGDLGYRFETVRRMYNNDMKHYPQDLIDRLCTYLNISVGELLEHKKNAE
ncbi:helix-turn-helix transcriptional regulator [Desulfosporosinus sp. PR]|uniref:helix-turn-helix domain-containing protein n=1 Tax=Candidatus Desulfosporosinus nitrosoreducens TaxID=3401928 RepID=UPI0027FFF32C|nr:helix-turn-helix transcriptional regulator [Desulfosporosinus sp. PR]MDQ7094287.1 helix-turn-helix transcriptional regulator [Desulfosporosinus sp. PR]